VPTQRSHILRSQADVWHRYINDQNMGGMAKTSLNRNFVGNFDVLHVGLGLVSG
jgi:hypothetical protein